MTCSHRLSPHGGVAAQVRECATALLHVAKREKIPVFLIGHVTKVRCPAITKLGDLWRTTSRSSQPR